MIFLGTCAKRFWKLKITKQQLKIKELEEDIVKAQKKLEKLKR